MLDVAVDADGAAVHDPPRARRPGRLDHRPHGGGVHRAVVLFTKGRLPVDRRDVVDDVDPLGGARDRCRVAEISANRLEAAGSRFVVSIARRQAGVVLGAPDERADVVAAGREARARGVRP